MLFSRSVLLKFLLKLKKMLVEQLQLQISRQIKYLLKNEKIKFKEKKLLNKFCLIFLRICVKNKLISHFYV